MPAFGGGKSVPGARRGHHGEQVTGRDLAAWGASNGQKALSDYFPFPGAFLGVFVRF